MAARATPLRRKWLLPIAGAGIVVAIVLTGLTSIPISHSFAYSFYPCGGSRNEPYAKGTSVSFQWNESKGQGVTFVLQYGIQWNSPVIYQHTGQNGSFSFTSSGGKYTYSAIGACPGAGSPGSAPVSIHGDWAQPLF